MAFVENFLMYMLLECWLNRICGHWLKNDWINVVIVYPNQQWLMVVMAMYFFALSWRGLWDYSTSCDETLLGRVVFANDCVCGILLLLWGACQICGSFVCSATLVVLERHITVYMGVWVECCECPRATGNKYLLIKLKFYCVHSKGSGSKLLSVGF